MNKIRIAPLLLVFSIVVLIISCSSEQSKNSPEQIDIKEDVSMNVQHYNNVADDYLRYLTEKNLEGILSLFADNATVEDPVGSEVIEGKAALRKFYSGAVTMDLKLERIGQVRVAGVEIAFPFQLEMNVENTPMITDIIDVFRFNEDGKIVSMRAFWGPDNRKKVSK